MNSFSNSIKKLSRILLLARLYIKATFLNIRITQTWRDDLIGCPSQCTYRFIYKRVTYEVYLRWRWSDPWTADLIVDDREWVPLNVADFSENELHILKPNAIWEAKKLLVGLYDLPKL